MPTFKADKKHRERQIDYKINKNKKGQTNTSNFEK